MLTGKRSPILIPPGVNKDDNSYTSFQWTDADKMRFYKGYPQMIGGWTELTSGTNQTITGVIRTIWAFVDTIGREHILIGTNTRLYSYEQNGYYNITPLVSATTAIPNSLSTNYGTLNNNPLSFTTGSNLITVDVASAPFAIGRFKPNDQILISGASNIDGFNPNGTFSVASVNTIGNTITYLSSHSFATTGSGGGAATVLSTRVITVAQVAHGFEDGDRIKITGSAAIGGFVANDINIEAIIRDVSANEYSYYSTAADSSLNFATSYVTGVGGAGVLVQGQIAAGNCPFQQALGYGTKLYSDSTYGTPRTGLTTDFLFPRIWSFDRYDDNIVLTPGDQGGLYLWAGDITTAPVLQTAGSAPTAINYVAVMNNQVVVFGSGGLDNRIQSTNDITNWDVNDPAVNAFDSDLLDAGRLIASEYCKGQYVIFTTDSVHKMTYVGSPQIWLLEDIMNSDGLLAPQAADAIQDNVVWVGQSNFYIYNGAFVSVIPKNTLNEWFFTNVNETRYYHSFCHKSVEFNEIWWFAPFGNEEEPNNYVIWNWQEGHWTNGTMQRTASENPTNPNRKQFMAWGQCDPVINGIVYQHEIDYTDNGNNLTGSLISNYNILGEGDYMQEILRVIPSTTLLPLGSPLHHRTLFNMYVYTKEYDSSQQERTFGAYPVSDLTEKIEIRANGRQRQYEFTFDTTDGFRIGKFFEELKLTTPR